MTFFAEIWTDGSCLRNPGPGGWAALVCYPENNTSTLSTGGEAYTTNNRMELLAAIKGIQMIPRASPIKIYSDSRYVISGFADGWIKNWKARNWLTANGSPVKNVDLWEQLDSLVSFHAVTWEWVRSHNGTEHNETVDKAARAEARRMQGGAACG